MAQSEQSDASSLPTRAIHESWLGMMNALKSYFQAENLGDDDQLSQAKSNLQHEVLGFYELLRPYISEEDAEGAFWRGEPPDYDGQGGLDDSGVAIIAWQDHRRVTGAGEIDWPEDDAHLTKREMHEQLGLGDNVRIVGRDLEETESGITLIFVARVYEMGLCQLDNWHRTRGTKTVDKGGFMKGKKRTETVTNTVGGEKLVRAARSLQEAAEEMDMLVRTPTPVEEDPAPI